MNFKILILVLSLCIFYLYAVETNNFRTKLSYHEDDMRSNARDGSRSQRNGGGGGYGGQGRKKKVQIEACEVFHDLMGFSQDADCANFTSKYFQICQDCFDT